jgi:hypothetical protein
MSWLDDIYNEDGNSNKHPSYKNINKLTIKSHEVVSPYDWALDFDLNPDWKSWQNEMNRYFKNNDWND